MPRHPASLRAVQAAEKAEAKRPLTVRAAADAGDRHALLVALRARIASDIDSSRTPARDLAALSRRLLEIVKEIEAIDSHGQGDSVGAAVATPDEEWASS